jgi:DNA-binding transcriptional MocR family regulator
VDQHERDCGATEPAENVIFLGTFSKIIAPALRVGWMVLPGPLTEKLVLMKQASDLHSSTINQIVLAEIMPQAFQSQVNKIIPVYTDRRDAMLKALEAHFPAGATWTRPAGGMFIWVELPAAIDTAKLLETALSQIGVAPSMPIARARTRSASASPPAIPRRSRRVSSVSAYCCIVLISSPPAPGS